MLAPCFSLTCTHILSWLPWLFIMCTPCFTWDAWSPDDETITLVEVTRSPFSRLLVFGDFVSGFGAFRLPHAIGHARRWEPAVSFGTKLRPISPFPAFTFKNVFPCRLTFDTFYNFFPLLRCFFELEKKLLNFEWFQTPKKLRCGG